STTWTNVAPSVNLESARTMPLARLISSPDSISSGRDVMVGGAHWNLTGVSNERLFTVAPIWKTPDDRRGQPMAPSTPEHDSDPAARFAEILAYGSSVWFEM